MNKIVVNSELCKGCGLCLEFCPLGLIAFGKEANKSGYFCAVRENLSSCTACGLCACMCPDSAIEVYKGC